MGIGTSLLLIAAGAILRFAVHAHVSGLDLRTVGLILMLAGVAGLVLTFLWLAVWRDRRRDRAVAYQERPVEYREPV